MELYRFRHRLFNGEMSGEIKREIFERGHAAVLLPYDPVRDEVVLVEQVRIAAYDTSETPWLLEMVAGMIEEGESVEDRSPRGAGRGGPGGWPDEAGVELPGKPGWDNGTFIYYGGRSGRHDSGRDPWSGR